MQRIFTAFVSTIVLSTLIAPVANAAQSRALSNLPSHLSEEVAQQNSSDSLPFHVREYLQNERVGR